MSRRQRSAPKVNVSSSVRLGLSSICEGNEAAVRGMLDAGPTDDLVEKLIDCMGVSNLNAEMLLANFFNAGILSAYAKRIGKSDKGGTATLAERIAREWAKPSFAPPAASSKRKANDELVEDVASKRATALEEIKAKRAKQQAKQAAATASTTATAAPEVATEAAATSTSSSDRQARGRRGHEAFVKRFVEQYGHPPAVIARLEMLDKEADELDKPYVGTARFTPSALAELGAEPTVSVQIMNGPGRFTTADNALVNPSLYEVYDKLHALCIRSCLEAIGELPQDPREFFAVDDYVGDSDVADVRAVFCLSAPADDF